MACRLVRAVCQELEERLGSGVISGQFIAECYSLVRKFSARIDIDKVRQNRDTIDKTLIDDIALGLYMTAVLQEEIRETMKPDIIQCFRKTVFAVFTDMFPRSSVDK